MSNSNSSNRFTHRQRVEELNVHASSPSDETVNRRLFYNGMGLNLQSIMRRMSWIADL